MEQFELEKFVQEHKKWRWLKAKWRSVEVVNGVIYEKVSEGIVRFANYDIVKRNREKRLGLPHKETKPRKCNDICLIEDILYYNENTKNYNVRFYITNSKTHKTKSTYTANGEPIAKQDYDLVITKKSKPIDTFFIKHLEDVIALG